MEDFDDLKVNSVVDLMAGRQCAFGAVVGSGVGPLPEVETSHRSRLMLSIRFLPQQVT